MFTAAAEGLLHQARRIQDEELQKFCSRVVKLLQKEELGPDAVDALQRLFLIVSATKYKRKLEKTCVDLLQTTLCAPKCPEQLQLLCTAILRERSPSDDLNLSCDHVQNSRQLSLVASVLLAQGDKKEEVRSVGQRAFRVLESRQPEGPSLRHLLPVVSKVTHLAPHTLHEDQTNLLSKRLVDWLRYASVQQGVPHTSGGFFSAPRARQPGPVTEVDGAVATDFFTVLSTGQHFTEDQWLNVQAFSMLRAWLLHSSPRGPSSPDTDDKSELEGSTLSVLSATSTASHLLPPQERLREKAFEYCQRLIEQSTRRALRKGDSDLQKACLVEAVLLLDVLCRQDPSFLYRTLSCLKALHARLCGDPARVRALLPIAQFFLNHGEAAAVDSEAILQHLFTRIPCELFHSPMLAFEFVCFCRDSLPVFGRNLDILRRSFPNLFKACSGVLRPDSWPGTAQPSPRSSWHSCHHWWTRPRPWKCSTRCWTCLVSLRPWTCSSGCHQLQPKDRCGMSPSGTLAAWRPPGTHSSRVSSSTCCVPRPVEPRRGTSQLWMRGERTHGPRGAGGQVLRGMCRVPRRLAPLHQLLQPLASLTRVVQCAEAVPTLLQAFFSAVTQFADGALSNQLALLLLERSDSLYQVPQYEAHVHRVLSSQFLVLCARHPSLVVELAKELLEFVGSVSSVHSREAMLTAVVWAVGEYLSVSWDRRCTVEQINRFFEVLEALLFEVTQSRPSATLPKCPPRVITVLMTTLTKLASRSQDLIPRVSLFLSKMRSLAQNPAPSSDRCGEDAGAVCTRAAELLTLLKMPSVAQFVLTPSAEVSEPRYHRDTNTALPLALRTVSRLVEKEAGLLLG
ncbi:AP-5 complex subunit zeta-1 isoform X1 [Vulpes vulpes]|uniref:AP-5 complex subunit zeta-1 isoform X1 n=1 Tax=Vulpes vulpes TaxID=9627 RepID=A0A3Q7TPB7_VULVU|nr:AP-5 complex subunit zeta-1 isoform X2 [Vulpes vulpes]